MSVELQVQVDILWQRIADLEKEIATLQRRLAGSQEELRRSKELENYYRGKYEVVTEIKNWWREWSSKEKEHERERETE